MSLRKAMRLSMRGALQSALAGEVTVFAGWALPTEVDELPALTVATPRQTYAESVMGGGGGTTIELVCLSKHAGGDDIEDTIDDFSEQIEALVDGWFTVEQSTFTGAQWVQLTDTQIKIEQGAGARVATMEMRFEAYVLT